MTSKISLPLYLISASLSYSCHNYIGINSSNSNNNVFYKGVENPLLLTGKNAQTAKVSISCGEIRLFSSTLDTAVYCLIPCEERTTLVTVISGKNTFQYIYRNKEIPNPFIAPAFPSSADAALSFYNSFSTFVSQENFKGFMGIRCAFIDFDYGCRSRVLDYDITRIRIDENDKMWRIDTLSNLSSRLPTEITYQVEKGDVYRISNCRIEISSIPYKLPVATEIRTLQDYLIVIK